MPALRVAVLWHQHQPFYKDLVSRQYRLPWVRLHGLKDYYGMVKLLDEFPQIHQTFNLVPSLIAQIQDYVAGTARDPLLELAAKPARDLTQDERRSALLYLFQANPVHLIGRYARYQELWERFRGSGNSPERAEKFFQAQDFTDLQVLSQLAWFDEFFLDQPQIRDLIAKGHGYTLEDQQRVIRAEREFLAEILPAHASAAQRGLIEISTSPLYHPILPLLCDTNLGAASSPRLPLPQNRFQYPEDAREQLVRGLELHEQVFQVRPRGVWPSEGSLSEEVLAIASSLGIEWMASDEGVLGRSLATFFARDSQGRLDATSARKLYTVYRYERQNAQMDLIFRDHTLSDLIGFVYSGMAAQEAAAHLIKSIRNAAQPLLDQGLDALVPIILDGENAWEYYSRSGREFLRRFYDALQKAPGIEAVTVSEAILRQTEKPRLTSIVPGSWINANFNVWIGAPEDNRAWDYLYHARNFYAQNAGRAGDDQRQLAYEELLIAEGSDWNWWYGPEHHSANDREFDELYRKHLSNVYQALGATAPEYLAQPIIAGEARPSFVPQTAYIHPTVSGDLVRYFEWIGAAMYTADQRSGSMHGKSFMLDSVYAGIDGTNLYGRLDFAEGIPDSLFELLVNIESFPPEMQLPCRALRLDVHVDQRMIQSWRLCGEDQEVLAPTEASREYADIKLVILRNFEFKLPLACLLPSSPAAAQVPSVNRLRLRFSIWQHRLPIDALPLEGWIELQLVGENELAAAAY
ncbi:MAG: glycoside hydrolase [Acidobacteria bacterium]|nr:glycoside hydrolase [Acidobacteriota bacterium]